jgi:hypothetical protein
MTIAQKGFGFEHEPFPVSVSNFIAELELHVHVVLIGYNKPFRFNPENARPHGLKEFFHRNHDGVAIVLRFGCKCDWIAVNAHRNVFFAKGRKRTERDENCYNYEFFYVMHDKNLPVLF